MRKFARDFVDSRFCVAEFFLPLAVIILVLSMVRVPSSRTSRCCSGSSSSC
ncbi:hypothetical protein SALBM135S_06760 [Streptomyces alboniger]